MNISYHVDVCGVLRTQNEWAILVALEGKSFKDQLAYLRSALKASVEAFDDQNSKKYLSLIFQVCADAEYRPFKKCLDGRSFYEWPDYSGEEETKNLVIVRQADLALELCKEIPPYQEKKDQYGKPCRVPALLESKRLIWTTIGRGWKMGPDEKAKEYFDFLFSCPTEMFDDSRVLDDVIRESLNGFSFSRIEEHLISAQGNKKDAMKKTMAIAWARENKSANILRTFSVCHPLNGCSQMAFSFVENVSKQIAERDKAIQALLAKSDFYCRDSFAKQLGIMDKSEITVSYPSMEMAKIEWVITKEQRYWGNTDAFKKEVEAHGHEWFEKIRDYIKEWQKQHPYCIEFSLTILPGAKSEQCFSRSIVLKV